MRDDLLDAQASVDWAVAQFPSLTKRIEEWLGVNVNIMIEDVPAPATHNRVVAVEKEPLPRTFNVEIGAYLNAIRSSLDILATSLADRYCIPRPENAYFPIVPSAAAFAAGNYKGSKFVKALPLAVIAVIKTLKPYHGGNEALWTLHHLDIMRKHRRLIGIEIQPLQVTISGTVDSSDFSLVASGWLRVNEKTVIGFMRKGAPDYDMQFVPQIALSEALGLRQPIVPTLDYFARMATTIIKLFDA